METDLIKPLSFRRHRYPAEAIRYAVWLYFSFTLILRDVEESLAQRGIEFSREVIRCRQIVTTSSFIIADQGPSTDVSARAIIFDDQ